MIFVLFAILPLAATAAVPEQHSGHQSYKVVGEFFCGSKPAGGVLVKLMDDDFGRDADDQLDKMTTDARGRFELKGTTQELTSIDPHLRIYHNCNDEQTPCERRWKFELPNKYITSGQVPTKTLDIGKWNLEARLPGESRDCQH